MGIKIVGSDSLCYRTLMDLKCLVNWEPILKEQNSPVKLLNRTML